MYNSSSAKLSPAPKPVPNQTIMIQCSSQKSHTSRKDVCGRGVGGFTKTEHCAIANEQHCWNETNDSAERDVLGAATHQARVALARLRNAHKRRLVSMNATIQLLPSPSCQGGQETDGCKLARSMHRYKSVPGIGTGSGRYYSCLRA